MKKIKSLLYAISAFLLVGLSSCGSDGPGSMNKGDAQAAFASVNTDLAAGLGDMTATPGFEGLNSFATITSSANPFGRISSYKRKEVREQLKTGLTAIRSMLVNSSSASGKVAGDEPFDYNGKKGIYTYNSETGTFSKTGESTIIKIFYPTEGSNTNNAEFRLSAYAEEATPNGDDLYSPTLVDATILIDQVVQAEFDLEAEYGDNDQPVFGDISVFFTPFTFKVKFDDRASTSSSVSESLSKDGSTLIAVGANVTYYSSDKSEANIKKLSAYLQLMRIKFVVSVETAELESPEDVKIAIKIDGKDAGDVILVMDEITGDVVPHVKYNDGSTESLESLFEGLATELEGILNPGA